MKNNIKFIPWFVGFCDAECSFITNLVPRKNKHNIITSYRIFYRIQIGLNLIDRPILEYINRNLDNIGKIYEYETRQESTLCFISLESIRYLIDKIFTDNSLLTIYQFNRLAKLKKGIFKSKSGNLKPKLSLEHTDEPALNFFKTHLELGPKVCQLKQRQDRKITYRIDITSENDLNKICKFLDSRDCLIGNKFNQYSNWKNKFNL